MICIKTCMLSTVIIFWFVSGMLVNKKTPVFTNLMNSLDDEQKQKFDRIVKERTSIFKKSLGGALILTLVLVLTLINKNMDLKKQICVVIVSSVFLMTLFYMIHPKSDYMVRHLKTQDQRDKWVKMRMDMGMKKYVGLGLGVFIYSLVNIM